MTFPATLSSKSTSAPRSIIYIDGLNLFNRVLKGTPNKWLDIVKLFKLLRHQDNIVRVKYFTALLKGTDRDGQEKYLKALEADPLLEVHLGRFQEEKQTCAVPGCGHCIRDYFVPKEKQTDVRISLAMCIDAMGEDCDQLVLVSGDSDLVPAIEKVKDEGKPALLYVPYAEQKIGQYAREIRDASTRWAHLPNSILPKVQLPDPVVTPHGALSKPTGW